MNDFLYEMSQIQIHTDIIILVTTWPFYGKPRQVVLHSRRQPGWKWGLFVMLGEQRKSFSKNGAA